jgi:hypothetical protein
MGPTQQQCPSCLTASNAFLPVLPVLQLEESAIIEHLEAMCDPSKPEGQWITNYDIVEKGKELKLVDTGKVRSCLPKWGLIIAISTQQQQQQCRCRLLV